MRENALNHRVISLSLLPSSLPLPCVVLHCGRRLIIQSALSPLLFLSAALKGSNANVLEAILSSRVSGGSGGTASAFKRAPRTKFHPRFDTRRSF